MQYSIPWLFSSFSCTQPTKPEDTLLAPYVAPVEDPFGKEDPFGAEFDARPQDLPPPPAPAPVSVPVASPGPPLPQATAVPPATVANEAETVNVTASVKTATAVNSTATPEAAADEFDAFLESLGPSTAK